MEKTKLALAIEELNKAGINTIQDSISDILGIEETQGTNAALKTLYTRYFDALAEVRHLGIENLGVTTHNKALTFLKLLAIIVVVCPSPSEEALSIIFDYPDKEIQNIGLMHLSLMMLKVTLGKAKGEVLI